MTFLEVIKMRKYLLIPILSVMFLAGCASVRESGCISSYSKLRPGRDLEKVFINTQFKPRDYDAAVISVDDFNIPKNKEIEISEIKKFLKEEIFRQFRNAGIFKDVVDKEKPSDAQSKLLICSIAITELNPGSRMARWLAGEFGAGNSVIQLEGEFSDAGTKEIMFSFADRRKGAASIDITGGDAKNLIMEDMRNIVVGIVTTLKEME